MDFSNSQEFLATEFQKRRQINARFSLRAFSKKVGISPGRLSEILSGKTKISLKMAETIALNLPLDSFYKEKLIQLVVRESQQKPSLQENKYVELKPEQYEILTEWKYFAIISLVETIDFKSSPLWIARRLSLPVAEVKEALQKLIDTGLIIKEGERFKVEQVHLTTTHNQQSQIIRLGHKSKLEKAKEQIDKIDINLRDYSSITMPIDPKKIGQAKLMIAEFRRKLSQFLESGNQEEVYALSIQLFPLTKPKDIL